MNYEALKMRQRAERDGYPRNLSLRVHRALSWLNRCEQLRDDQDGQYVFLWIAFNAAYATNIEDKYRQSEQRTFQDFIRKLVALDKHRRIEALVWTEFPKSIRVLLDNRYVFHDFWESQNGALPREAWEARFAAAKKAALAALANQDTVTVLSVVLARLYTLRNQLVHGGATWNSAVNRDQVRDCTNLLGKLVPLIIEIMMDNPQTLWGDACYPVVD